MCWAIAMTRSGSGKQTSKHEESGKRGEGGCKILPFRRRGDAGDNSRPAAGNECYIDRLIDLSRYEELPRYTDDYRCRMVENLAAVLLLSALVVIAALDVIGLEQIQHCTLAGAC